MRYHASLSEPEGLVTVLDKVLWLRLRKLNLRYELTGLERPWKTPDIVRYLGTLQE